MNKFLLGFRRRRIITPPLSDLVALGILSKPISEFTNDDIGTIIPIPYNDESGTIALNENGCIEFEVVAVNHHKSVDDETKPTITLMTKGVLRYAALDAEEPNNPDSNRVSYGNNRWSVSNIRQWLNSSGAANSWFTKQHDYDEAPTVDKISNEYAAGAYADDPGFLAGFSDEIKQHFTDIANTTALCVVDGEGSETTIDKVFLASYTEMEFGINHGISEGAHLAIRYPDNNSRIKQRIGSNKVYWLRSTASWNAAVSYRVNANGTNTTAYDSSGLGIAPLIVLH